MKKEINNWLRSDVYPTIGMDDMKTKQDNNRLIAEFMGFTQGKADEIRFREDWFDNDGVINGQRNVHLHFDTSWDWLMPVVDKILSIPMEDDIYQCNYIYLGFDHEDNSHYVNLFVSEDKQLNGYSMINKIEAVYNTVISFINWHNSQKSLSSCDAP